MMWRALVLALLVPVQAQALSCMPWSLEHAYTAASESSDDYVIVRGVLKFDATQWPDVDWDIQENTPPETRIPARLTGQALSRAGFTQAYDQALTLSVLCFGPWCPGPYEAGDVLAFVRQTKSGSEVGVDACGGMLFSNPTRKMLRRVRDCVKSRGCTPEER